MMKRPTYVTTERKMTYIETDCLEWMAIEIKTLAEQNKELVDILQEFDREMVDLYNRKVVYPAIFDDIWTKVVKVLADMGK